MSTFMRSLHDPTVKDRVRYTDIARMRGRLKGRGFREPVRGADCRIDPENRLMHKSLVFSAFALTSSLAAQQPQTPAAGAPPRGRGPFAGATQIKEGEACPPGMTEIRPRACQGPEMPAPTILDYRP